MGRVLAAIILLMVGSACIAVTHNDAGNSIPPRNKRFLESCSGISIYDITTNSFAYGVCMGFARGVVEGHQLTVELAARASRDQQPAQTAAMPRLWCVPGHTTNDELMQTVLAWIKQNPAEYDALTKQFDGINAATAVIIKSINKGFRC